MSPSPAIVFTAFRSATDPRLQGWATLRRSVEAGTVVAVAATDAQGRPARPGRATPTLGLSRSGIWRLLASNSREIGRSSAVYGSFAVARAHVLELQELVDDMVPTTVTGPTAGTHGWIVTVGQDIVMTSARWYGAASMSREVSAGTIKAFRAARVMEDARYSTESGSRGSRVLTEQEKALSW